MSKILRTGAVMSDAVPVKPRKKRSGHIDFALRKGRIIAVRYPEDSKNQTDKLEFVLRVGNNDYFNAVDIRTRGAIYNHSTRIKKPSTKSFTNKVEDSVLDKNWNGEIVYVLFLDGNEDVPIIIGAAEHPRQYKKYSKADGEFDVDEFNGIEFKVDNDGNYTISQVGRKDKDGNIVNPQGVGTQFSLNANGDIVLDTGVGIITIGKNGNVNLQNDIVTVLWDNDGTISVSNDKVQMVLSNNGDITLTNDEIVITIANTGKVSIVNSNGTDLVQEGYNLADETMNITVLTGIGIQPVINKNDIKDIRDKIGEFI